MGKILQNLSVKLGLIFFGKRKTLSYCIFNYFFSIFIINKATEKKLIYSFNKNGFAKLNENFSDEIEKIGIYLNRIDRTNQAQKHYQLDLNTKSKIIDIFLEKLTPILNDLENNYNFRPVIVDATVWSNNNFKRESKNDLISESFHCDGYLSNYFKIHINFKDVTKQDGPMTIVKKEYNKKFIKDFNYLDRHSYKKNSQDMPYIYKNVGKKGEALMFDAANAFHCANIPQENNIRTMIQLVFFVPPYKLDNSNQVIEFFDSYKKYTKPYSIMKMLILLFKYRLRKNL